MPVSRSSYSGPAFLSVGFRPFFLLAGLYAAALMPIWLWHYRHGEMVPAALAPLDWHIHELLFGFLAAVITGFALTAIPNWTGRLPVRGGPLAGLVFLWLVARVAVVASAMDPLLLLMAPLFPLAVAGLAMREVVAGANWRNLPVAMLLALLALSDVGFVWQASSDGDTGPASRCGLAAVAMLLLLIGGRVTPSFTRNWLAKRKSAALPAPFGAVDRLALALAVLALLAWVVAPEQIAVAWLLGVAGCAHIVRLLRWQGMATTAEPLVLVLHVGYLWLPVAFILLALAILFPELLSVSSGVHALTAGAMGTMPLAVMTRATLGHTGRALTADSLTTSIFAFVVLAALLRVLAPVLDAYYDALLVAAGGFWTGAFLLFLMRFGPMLIRPGRT